MLTLGAKGVEFRNFRAPSPRIISRVTDRANRPQPLRSREAFLVRDSEIANGFNIYVALKRNASVLDRLASGDKAIVLPDEFEYLGDGDIIRLQPEKGAVRVLYRWGSSYNSLLLTERCNHYCLMCSQPPRDIDDSWIVDEILEMIPLIDPATPEIGFTGGEPTLLGGDLFKLLRAAKSYLPQTAIHILSNGRRFVDERFTMDYAAIQHPDLMVGIPIYSDISTIHDYVVQADNAFDETIRGILNLKRYDQKVEIRVVIHKQTYARLPQLAEFIARNLMFVDHVALMGLEITGFTKPNLEDLWIDPVDYRNELYAAATLLEARRMNVSIYNHQLCLLDKRVWHLSRKSISDWKNEYMPECEGCCEKQNCGGFFSSARLRYSPHIRPLQ